MLKKLLKYDFKSVFKFWWIAAVVALSLCIAGGGCITVLRIERELPQIVDISAGFMIGFAVIGLVAFSLISTILIFIRYYKNFFTDEGYLTFTLPVKRGDLLNSKLIMSVGTYIITVFTVLFGIAVMLGIGFSEEIFTKETYEMLGEIWKELTHNFGFYLPVYALEFIAIFVLSFAFSVLFLYCCITLASVITKKARIITSIGIYYGTNMVISFVMEIFFLFGMQGIISHLAKITEANADITIAVVLLGIVAFLTVFCAMMYTLVYYMLDRKLNLS